jgi:hypothetical protein
MTYSQRRRGLFWPTGQNLTNFSGILSHRLDCHSLTAFNGTHVTHRHSNIRVSKQLSDREQLQSETRTFTGLGSFSLSYEYNLGSQLKSLTDHTNQRVNYSFDNAGRINNISGTNYISNQFITSAKYRAWGGSSEVVYGNGLKATYNYNARLRPLQFRLLTAGGLSTVATDYQYYADGRLKYSQDVLDNKFDRSYEYDHAVRLTKALSGAEARGEPATTNRPYKETATYDAFSHLNTRSSLHWSRTLGFGSSDTYVNNRRVGWTYDADGNWLSGAGRQHTYDAAGRTKTITWTYGGQFNQFFDGDGQRVKTVEGNSVIYYLRSTVLGGQVVEELSSAGAKEKGFIYAGQKLIAYQSQNGNVSLLHEDASGVTQRASTPQSAAVSYWAETDPWGAEVYHSDPYVQDPGFSGGRGEGGPVFPGFGDISMPSTGCTLDGVYSLCDFISRGVNSGALALQLSQGGKTKQFPFDTALIGISAVWVEDEGEKLPAGTKVGDHLSEIDIVITNTNSDGLGHWEFLALPQNTGLNQGRGAAFTDRQKEILGQVHNRINKKDCRDFINALLADNKVAADRNTLDKLLSKADFNTYNPDATHTQLGVSMDALIELRDSFNNKGVPAATIEGHVFFTSFVFQREYSSILPASAPGNRNIDTATIAVHELLHVAGLKDPQVQKLNRQIHDNCGFKGMDY